MDAIREKLFNAHVTFRRPLGATNLRANRQAANDTALILNLINLAGLTIIDQAAAPMGTKDDVDSKQ